MIIGSGLLARAFSPVYDKNGVACIYAAGVSNSGCVDEYEFDRERRRLTEALDSLPVNAVFVYFSTCSIYDSDMEKTAYVRHKLAMEELVSNSTQYLIFRLPQVVGRTPNPHTLLNYLYARITRSERLHIWKNARRNVIDVDDVVLISDVFIQDPDVRNIALNIANPKSYSIAEIVDAFESVLNKKAICEFESKGNEYSIDVHQMQSILDKSGVEFDGHYLEKIINKYYANK